MAVQKCCLTLGWDTIGWGNISPDVQILGIDLSPVGEKNAIKIFDYTTIADRLSPINWSNDSYLIDVFTSVYLIQPPK